MNIAQAILNHVAPIPQPTLPPVLRTRIAQVGYTYTMDRGYGPGDGTGITGQIVRICDDGDVEIEGRWSGWVHHTRIRLVRPDGSVRPCLNDVAARPESLRNNRW